MNFSEYPEYVYMLSYLLEPTVIGHLKKAVSFAERVGIINRYSKQALQIMRIRKAVSQLAFSPDDFNYETYGYYDHSHFKHPKQFLQKDTLKI